MPSPVRPRLDDSGSSHEHCCQPDELLSPLSSFGSRKSRALLLRIVCWRVCVCGRRWGDDQSLSYLACINRICRVGVLDRYVETERYREQLKAEQKVLRRVLPADIPVVSDAALDTARDAAAHTARGRVWSPLMHRVYRSVYRSVPQCVSMCVYRSVCTVVCVP
jgi:hypothetical protein